MFGTSSNVRIREFLPPDTEAVLAIYAASKLDELALEATAPRLIPLQEDRRRFAVFQNSATFIAETNRPIGYVSLLESQVTSLFVHPEARGRGVGCALLSHALSIIGGAATLSVAASNAPAIRLYERHGFTTSSRFVAEYNGVHVSALTMRRAGEKIMSELAGA